MMPKLPIIPILFVTLAASHFGYVQYLKHVHKAEIEAEKQECVKKQQITQRFSNALQKNVSHLNGRLDTLKRVHPKACVPVTEPSGEYDGSPNGEHDRRNGIDTDTLLDYSGIAEKYRQQLISCQGFVTEIVSQ